MIDEQPALDDGQGESTSFAEDPVGDEESNSGFSIPTVDWTDFPFAGRIDLDPET